MIWALLCGLGCGVGADAEPFDSGTLVAPPLVLPPVDALPEQVDPPDPYVSWATGERVDWATRRAELEVLFPHYVYGVSAAPVTAVVVERSEHLVEGGRLVQLLGRADAETEVALQLVVWLPEGGPRAVVLGLNKCGNPSVRDEPAVLPGTGWVPDDCPAEPGGRASYWGIDEALDQGFAVATFHASDVHPDDPDVVGMLGWSLPGAPEAAGRWGAIGAWAWGLSRAVDLLESELGDVPVVVMGHSRRGKTALWATAQDERIDGVWAHQSGTAGAALSRHLEGEPIGAMTLLFPHWFPERFATFAGEESRLPVDQHLLIAMAAPRPVRITDGDDDAWADPEGARQAVERAAPVFSDLGGPPPVWALRPGGHEVTLADWSDALAWWSDVGPR